MHPHRPSALALLALLFSAGFAVDPLPAQESAASPRKAFDPENAFISFNLDGFFPGTTKGGGAKRLNAYLVRREGKWVAGLGTATIQGRAVWNTALMPIDASGLTANESGVSGTLKITLVPDPWIPKDQTPREATITVDARIGPASTAESIGSLTGSWKATIPGDEAELKAAELQGAGSGNLTGGVGGTALADLSEASYDFALYRLVPGKPKEQFHTRRGLSIGIKDGKPISARVAQIDMRQNAYDHVFVDTPTEADIQPDTFRIRTTFASDTLDGDPAKFDITLTGMRVAHWLVGRWEGTWKAGDGTATPIHGFFRGDVRKTPAAAPLKSASDDRPWFEPVNGWKPVQPAEHPRLFFRKSDVAELKRRAATPDGQKIIARLRQLLNGTDGESMPTLYNPATKAYEENKFKAAPGAYSVSHGAGYGLLYQLTGDTKYAQLARECVELAWKGQRSFDDRYSWVAPGGELRAGPSVGWTAVAYDLCYDAWPEDFRRKCALAIQDYADTGGGGEWNNNENLTLRSMVLTPRQGPGSNHYGAVIGGCGLAVLAIKGDPGTDSALLDKYCRSLESGVVRHLSAGWGDGGYYKEGWGASRVGTQTAWLSYLLALKVAQGRDYVNVDRPNASYVTMVPRCLLVLGPPGYFPYRSNMGGTYGNPEIGSVDQRNGFSNAGYFSEGFGAVADRHKPALLWTYNHIFNADGKDVFDTFSLYPHRAMLALINWPTFAGLEEKNPAEVMPRVTRDTLYEYFAFRNRWQDKDDIVTSVLINQPDGTKPREVMVWGLGGLRLDFGEPARGATVSHFAAGEDGSGTLTAGAFALAVDYSKASGADAVIVTLGSNPKDGKPSEKCRVTRLTLGTTPVAVMTLSASGQHPEARVEGDKVILGGQTFRWADGKLTLAKFTPAK